MSEQTDQNVEHIKKGYEAFAAGDVETLMSLFDDNIEWIQPGDSAVSGIYHGKGELGELLNRWPRSRRRSPPPLPGRR